MWTIAGIVEKMGFLAINASVMGDMRIADVADIVWHGLRLDFAIAAYLTILPAIIIAISVWKLHRALKIMWNCYFLIVSVIVSLAFLSNIILYGYWGFPLDSTPIFYFLSSPADALASGGVGQIIGALIGLAICSAALFFIGKKIIDAVFAAKDERKRCTMDIADAGIAMKCGGTLVVLLVSSALFIPIRGGFSVAVNNVGSVYFSDNVRLNHAAVNPLFSVMESLSHEEDFASQYRYMDDDKATELFSSMTYTEMRTAESTDSIARDGLFTDSFLNAMRGKDSKGGVNVVIVVLESFHNYIMTGGEGNLEGVTPCLEKLMSEGISFTHFHANSFRTDRGLVSILSGYPAQPTTSLMKYPHKTNGLFSIARSLAKQGYDTEYVYGGDANFTNMRSYLMATGFGNVISEDDYPAKDITGKWGVNDSVLFDKALTSIYDRKDRKRNAFRVVQTSSSHEPFDVPHHYLDNRPLNAFHYTDEQLGRFVNEMKAREEWERTLVLIVPDHAGCYPEPEPDGFKPYFSRIPFVMVGGGVKKAMEVSTIACQQDIAATLLAMLEVDHSEFVFSKDIFDNRAPHFAFFTFPDAVGMVTEDDHFMFDNRSKRMIYNIGKPSEGENLHKARAYLQKLYDDLAER